MQSFHSVQFDKRVQVQRYWVRLRTAANQIVKNVERYLYIGQEGSWFLDTEGPFIGKVTANVKITSP